MGYVTISDKVVTIIINLPCLADKQEFLAVVVFELALYLQSVTAIDTT
jgi:hypothetical protein